MEAGLKPAVKGEPQFMNTPINRGAILIDSSMSEEFVLYEISTLLQQGVLKGPQTPISARFSGLP